MLSQFLTYLVDDLKKAFKEAELCIHYPAFLSPEILSKNSALYISASGVKKTEILATGDKRIIAEMVVYVRVMTSPSTVEDITELDLVAQLLNYILNKKWQVSYAFTAQELQAQDCYGIHKEEISSANWKLPPSVLTRAQMLYDNAHLEREISLWVVSWEQPLKFVSDNYES